MPEDRSRSRVLVWVTVITVGLVAILGAGYAVLGLSRGDTAPSGTTVAGVDVSGMTQSQAEAAVRASLEPMATKKIRVKADGETFVVLPADSGLTVDVAASVAPAFIRSWNPLSVLARLTTAPTLPAVTSIDPDALNAQIDSIAFALDHRPVEPTVRMKNGQPTAIPGAPGHTIDRDALADQMSAAFLAPRKPIVADVIPADPQVTQAAVETAMQQATAAVSAPVTVRAGGVTAEIPAAVIADALSFTSEGTELTPALDGATLHAAIAKDLAPVEESGRDATFKIKNGKPKVVKSKVGSGVSDEELATAVAGVMTQAAGQRDVTVALGPREPKVTTQELQELGVTERMSSFTQEFPYAAYRKQNIGEAARRINGTLLRPGETFSMNDTIKERTEANGYTIGFVVGEGGVFDEQLGGGVSTATTATWTAAFYAGMERVQTIAHSIYISRYKPGLEATVAWGIFDMKFRNDTPNAVFITANAWGTGINVQFWGTKQYDKIDAEYGERTSIVKFDTIYDATDKCLGQEGVDGFTITVDRVFYKDGKEVKREPITTHYKPAPKVVCGKEPGKKKDGKGQGGKADQANATSSDGASVDPSTSPSPRPKPTKPGSGQAAPAGGGDTFTNP